MDKHTHLNVTRQIKKNKTMHIIFEMNFPELSCPDSAHTVWTEAVGEKCGLYHY